MWKYTNWNTALSEVEKHTYVVSLTVIAKIGSSVHYVRPACIQWGGRKCDNLQWQNEKVEKKQKCETRLMSYVQLHWKCHLSISWPKVLLFDLTYPSFKNSTSPKWQLPTVHQCSGINGLAPCPHGYCSIITGHSPSGPLWCPRWQFSPKRDMTVHHLRSGLFKPNMTPSCLTHAGQWAKQLQSMMKMHTEIS